MAIIIFLVFIAILLALSFHLSNKAKSASGYFIAGGKIHWAVNGIALTGGYLSAASFLGICGMIAFTGFDGYLYSIGFLSGWVVALFVVAEPMRRLGKFTFADALASKFDNKGIHFAAGISTLIISLCYLVPQMVGAGVLMEPLTGLPHYLGVIIVGSIVIVIVATAGMASTTYVQFLKASLLILFCAVIVAVMCWRGLNLNPQSRNIIGEVVENRSLKELKILKDNPEGMVVGSEQSYLYQRTVRSSTGREWVVLSRQIPLTKTAEDEYAFLLDGENIKLKDYHGHITQLEPNGASSVDIDGIKCTSRNGILYANVESWWLKKKLSDGENVLQEVQCLPANGSSSIHPKLVADSTRLLAMGRILNLPPNVKPGRVGPFEFLSIFADKNTIIGLPRSETIQDGSRNVTLYYHKSVRGNELMRPGGHFDLKTKSPWSRLDFISLMLALFFGTAALPHVLIRYYTVPDSNAARKSTLVAIGAIGFFYILTLYLGLGAIANGVLNPLTTNMTAPLLARSFGETLFAAVSSVAFATVLGTVSGLIVAAAGAVANDLVDCSLGLSKSENSKVIIAKLAAVAVGITAMGLGILLRGMNVGFLVGWAFAVAASANFPAILMVLFWKRTTAQGIIASIFVGIISSIGIILLGPDMFELYGFQRQDALIPIGQPGIISIPLSFLVLVIVSLLTKRKKNNFSLLQEAAKSAAKSV